MKRLMFTMLFIGFISAAFATQAKKQLQLNLQAPNRAIDQTTIYFDLGVSPAYYSPEDAPKEMSSIAGVPNLYSVSTDNVKCAINGYSALTQSAVISLGVLIDTTGTYTFSLAQFSNFDASTLVILEDRKLNMFTEMQTNFYQAILSSEDTTGRFFLHITRAVQFVADTSGCSNNNGAINVNSDSAVTWSSVALLDSSNNPITTYNSANGQFAFSGLAEGSYNVQFNYNGYSAVKTLSVSGTHIVASFSASSQNVAVGENIQFYSTAINTSQYVWEYGDSTIETGVANPTFFYYEPGTYTVNLICSNNYGCSVDLQMTINVGVTGIDNTTTKGISIINLAGKNVQVNMNDVDFTNAQLDINNILGQIVYTSPVTAQQMQVSLSDKPAGIYLVTVRHGNKSTTTKIYITD